MCFKKGIIKDWVILRASASFASRAEGGGVREKILGIGLRCCTKQKKKNRDPYVSEMSEREKEVIFYLASDSILEIE